jgi:aerobic carbon-monoxide dehydrogenase large subunit
VNSEGKSVLRKEDARFVAGSGQYVDDIRFAGELHASFVRSPHAHARILGIATEGALQSPGVVAIFTGAELCAAGVGSIPCGWLVCDREGRPMAEPPRYPLAVDKVRHVGDPVAVVIADSVAHASEAVDAVLVDYEPLDAVADVGAALRDGAPAVWNEHPGNVCCDWWLGDEQAVTRAFTKAAHVTRISLVNNRLIPAPMEPRAAVASFDRGSGRYTLYTTSQNPHTVRSTLSAVLRIAETDLRVISPDVGGGFGAKIFVYPEETTLCWVSGRVGRTVRWTSDRSEAFLTDANGRDHRTQAELALDDDGRFLALRVKTLANVGAYLTSGATVIPTYYYAPLLAGVYITPHICCNVVLTFTNTCSVDAYRGAGRPEATYVLERLIDQAARETGHDRVELRRKNFIPTSAFPYETPVGMTYDFADHEATLRMALEKSDWANFAVRRAAAAARGQLRGIGVSTYVEIAGGTPSKLIGQLGGRGGRAESAHVRVHPTGTVTVFSGSHSHGQSHETTFAQIVAARLGIPVEHVRVVQGDTDQVPFGRGTAASRSLVIGGSAILKALGKVIDKGRRIAAHRLEIPLSDVEFEAGEFRVAGTDRTIHFREVARAAYTLHDFPIETLEPGLDETAFYDPLNWTFPSGCHICEVEIDPTTGTVRLERVIAVDDVGEVINPMVVHGQIHGGLAQGLGQALMECCVHDEQGQLLTGSFMDYAMPRASDLPLFEVYLLGTRCDHNPLGAKGCAEVGSVGVPPAVVNAILDALAPLGVTHIDMPASPLRVWEAIQKARQK